MKTYTLEELRLAQAKKCRVEFKSGEGAEWKTVAPLILAQALVPEYAYRIHPADEWKARLPRLKEGAEWACDGSSYDENERPLIVGEVGSYLFLCDGAWEDGLCHEKPEEPFTGVYRKTSRPVPPEFLHPDELAKQPGNSQLDDRLNEPSKTLGQIAFEAFGNAHKWESSSQKDGWQRAAMAVIDAHKTQILPTMNTPQTDAPETDAASYDVSYLSDMGCTITATYREPCDGGSHVDSDFARTLERRAIAAEARVKELESKIADVERRNYNTNRRLSDVLAERSALRLRPIAEAGPVPEGMVRVFTFFHEKHKYWIWYYSRFPEVTHFIDIYPPHL